MTDRTARVALAIPAVVACLTLGPAGAHGQESRLSYRLPGMEEALVRKNIVYKKLLRGTALPDFGNALSFDLYRPASGSASWPTPGPGTTPARRPALIYIPGGIVPGEGYPLPKEWPQYADRGRLAAAAGLVGVVATHRLTIRDSIPEAAEDVRDLLSHLRSHASEYGIDPDRLALAIYSAGGPLVSPFLRWPEPYVRSVVLFYPFLDLEHLRTVSPFRDPVPAERVDRWQAHSPAAVVGLLPDQLPPLFLARAGQDAIPHLNESIERFMAEVLEHDVAIDFHLHRTGAHGFDTNPDARSTEIVRASLEVVLRHFDMSLPAEKRL
ncbi:MAG: alpha/beta hydrolase [Candidatus Eiseniibacteriota bacterium]